MNRVLSLPAATVDPQLLRGFLRGQHETVVTDLGTVVLSGRRGDLEMRFSPAETPIEVGQVVVVWWKNGGFVCTTAQAYGEQVQKDQQMADRVAEARALLLLARQQREARHAQRAAEHADSPSPGSDTVSIY